MNIRQKEFEGQYTMDVMSVAIDQQKMIIQAFTSIYFIFTDGSYLCLGSKCFKFPAPSREGDRL